MINLKKEAAPLPLSVGAEYRVAFLPGSRRIKLLSIGPCGSLIGLYDGARIKLHEDYIIGG